MRIRRIRIRLLAYQSPDLRNKFADCIRDGASGESFRATLHCVLPIAFAGLAPGVRKEVIAESSHVSGISGVALSVGVVSAERKIDDVLDTLLERRVHGVEISRI